MKKAIVFIITPILTILIAALYGIVHDQITYTISSEYFTKFKYDQFGFDPVWFGGHRQTVAVIGLLATWWTGLIIGLVFSLIALIFTDAIAMRKALQRAVMITFCITLIMGLIGYLYGKLVLAKSEPGWYFPDNLIDKQAFITVGSIHNFGYLGGLIGLITGIVYLLRVKYTRRFE